MTNKTSEAVSTVSSLRRNGAAAFCLEALCLFGALLLFERVAMEPGALAAMSPSPYWIPVVLLAVQRGVIGGVLAAVIATALVFLTGDIPARAMTESVAAYRAGLLEQPLLWLLAGSVIGGLRSRQAALERLNSSALVDAREQNLVLADGIEDLRARNRALERRIAADAASVGAAMAYWSVPADVSTRQVLEAAAPFMATAAQATALGVYECVDGGFQHVSGSGPERLINPHGVLKHPNLLDAGTPWGVPLTASDGETVIGAAIVHELQDGVDAQTAHDGLMVVAQGLQGLLAAPVETPAAERSHEAPRSALA